MLSFFPDALYQWTSLVRGHLALLYFLLVAPYSCATSCTLPTLWGTSRDCSDELPLHAGLTRHIYRLRALI